MSSDHALAVSRSQLGSKENLLQALSMVREMRANHELEAAAVYLHRNIPYFINLTLPQIVELCRVAETTTIQGHNILFRQGQIGQAFYVVLSGEVEVWVDDSKEFGLSPSRPANTSRSESTNITNTSKNYLNLVSDLGKKVATLTAGDVFGEKALEDGNSERRASIVTCVDFTDLMVILKDDYLNLVYTIMNSDSMDRLSLLRRTEMFRAVDVKHLKVLARFMEPRRFKIDEALYKSGENATEMLITESGECKVLLDVKEDSVKIEDPSADAKRTHKDSDLPVSSSAKTGKGQGYSSSKLTSKAVDLGRIAPHSVLAAYITLCESAYHDILHTETIVASTIVDCFVISKHDFFLHVPKETKIALKKIVSEFSSLPVYPLWENVPRLRNREEWIKEKCWETFRKDMIKNEKRDSDILEFYKKANSIVFQVRFIHSLSRRRLHFHFF